MASEAHVHCYTHRQGTLAISVKKLPEILLPGEREGKIWMWHRCLQCSQISGFLSATRRVVMSDASRVASCGHSLHRDCLRFYGFRKMVACFQYTSIDVHSVYLPPHKLDFNYEYQKWIKKEGDEYSILCVKLWTKDLLAPKLVNQDGKLQNLKEYYKGRKQNLKNRSRKL